MESFGIQMALTHDVESFTPALVANTPFACQVLIELPISCFLTVG